MRTFATRQSYIFPKNHPMPVHLEGIEEANTIENIDGDRYYVSVFKFRCLAYIQNEEEFEITKTSRVPRFGVNLDR